MVAHGGGRISRLTRSDVVAVVVAIVIVVCLAVALRPQHVGAAPVTPTAAQVNRPEPGAEPQPSVLFIGDSYTAGSGLREMSPSCRAAVRLGWVCHLSAIPGTGYVSGGPANRFTVDPYIGRSTTFSERIPGLGAVYHPDIVVLDGGRNDQFPPRQDVYKAMAATIADVRRTWPTATLVFLRPRLLADPDDDMEFDDRFMARLAAEPASEGMVILDPIKKFVGTDTSGMLSEDGIHPNRRGEQALATALANALAEHGWR